MTAFEEFVCPLSSEKMAGERLVLVRLGSAAKDILWIISPLHDAHFDGT